MEAYLLLFLIVTVFVVVIMSYAVENKELDYNLNHDIQICNGVVSYLLLLSLSWLKSFHEQTG